MLIRSVALENIKSYKRTTKNPIRFQEGTNAISGENGSGKSTILEAIGYALFDYKPYKIENMVRHGQKKGEIRVLIRGVDGRDYEVVRTIRTKGGTSSYYIHDPKAGGKIAEGKNDVLHALRKDILCLGEETVLPRLFEDVIGVPQGTIMAPFLEAPGQRKEKFDPILGIEDYKKAEKESRVIENQIEKKKNEIDKNIAIVSVQVENFPEKKDELERIATELAELTASLNRLNTEFGSVREKKANLERLEGEISGLESRIRELNTQKMGAEKRREECNNRLQQAQEARKIVMASQVDFQEFLRVEKEIIEVDKLRDGRDKEKEQLHVLQRKEAGLKEKISGLENELKKIKEAEERMPEVKKKLGLQKEMEENKKRLEQALSLKQEKMKRIGKIEEELENGRKKSIEFQGELKDREALLDKVKEKESLDKRLEALRKRETNLMAEINHFQSNREALKTGECPFFREHCPKIIGDASQLFVKEENEIRSSLENVRESITSLQVEALEIVKAEKRLQEMNVLIGKEHSLREAIQKDEEGLTALKKEVAEGPDEREVRGLEKKIGIHGDFRGEHYRLKKDLEKRPEVEEEIREKHRTLEELAHGISEISKRIETFGDLEKKRQKLERKKEGHRKGYDDYRTHKKESEKVTELQERLVKIQKEIEMISQGLDNTAASLAEKKELFNKEELERVKRKFDGLNQEIGTIGGRKNELLKQQEKLIKELQKMEELMEKKKGLERDLGIEKSTELLIKYIREIFKKTPEYLRKRYVAVISQDANNRFHELMGDNTLDIRWTAGEEEKTYGDYGIVMRKGRDETEFNLLSGGQQMSAALAVRLALIRHFSGLNIAFFDEPTHNLDEERRDNLARAFSRITGFDQLFVISHDETFNSVIENAIVVRMVNGESVVEG